jgi:long-chain acyl-CoA synthetase
MTASDRRRDRVVTGVPLPEPGLANSLVALVERSVRREPGAVAMRSFDPAGRAWVDVTYAELWWRVRETSIGLASLGVRAGDRVLVLSRSRPEWGIADLAILALGGVTCPIFSGEGPMRVGEIARRIGASVAFVESAADAALLRAAAGSSAPGTIITFDAPSAGEMAFEEVADRSSTRPSVVRRWELGWQRLGPDDVASVVHAFGRDGRLVGAVLTHRNVLRNFAMVVPALRLTRHDVALSILPLSHMLERGTGLYVPLGLGATVAYAPLGRRDLTEVLRATRPTVMVVVPLVIDRVAGSVRTRIRRLAPWQRGLVLAAMRAELRRRVPGCSLAVRVRAALLRGLVTRPIRRALGGRLRFIACGGSRLTPRTGRFLTALGIPVVEGYGLTETAPLVTLNELDHPRFGTVGRPLPGTTVRIDADGEVLVRGAQVMRGYLDDPNATAAAIDAEGWLHTGDLGHLDADGRLVLTGVLKPLVVLATGKKVAREPIRRALGASPLIAHVDVGQDRRHELRVTVWPDPTALAAAGLDGDDAAVRRAIEREVDARLAGFGRYERPRTVEVAAGPHRLHVERLSAKEPSESGAASPALAPHANRDDVPGRTSPVVAPGAHAHGNPGI